MCKIPPVDTSLDPFFGGEMVFFFFNPNALVGELSGKRVPWWNADLIMMLFSGFGF